MFYKNQSLSKPNSGMEYLNCWWILAIISGYEMVTGRDCWDTDFQYILLNWYIWSMSLAMVSGSSTKERSVAVNFIFIGKWYSFIVGLEVSSYLVLLNKIYSLSFISI